MPTAKAVQEHFIGWSMAMVGMTAPTRRPGGRTAIVTKKIYDAATALLVEGGYEMVTFQAVAERAQVARATLYRRWEAPVNLIGEAVRISAAENIAIRDLGSLRGDLHFLLSGIATFIVTPLGRASAIVGLKLSGADDDRDQRTMRWARRWDDIVPIFTRAQARGELPQDIDAELLFAKAAGAVYFRTIVMDLPVDDDWIERILNEFLSAHAVQPTPNPTSPT